MFKSHTNSEADIFPRDTCSTMNIRYVLIEYDSDITRSVNVRKNEETRINSRSLGLCYG